MNNLKHRMRFSAIPESDEKTSESPARPTRMSETPKTNGKTRRRSLDRRTPMRKSLNFREGAEYLSAEERKRRNKLLQDRMYLMKYESELTKKKCTDLTSKVDEQNQLNTKLKAEVKVLKADCKKNADEAEERSGISQNLIDFLNDEVEKEWNGDIYEKFIVPFGENFSEINFMKMQNEMIKYLLREREEMYQNATHLTEGTSKIEE